MSSGFGSPYVRYARMVALTVGFLLIAFAIVNGTRSAWAANPPPEFADVVVADELFAPVQLAMAPDGRVVVLTDSGKAELIKDDVLQNTPLFDIRSQVEDVGDRGLLSMAYDNNFAVNGYIYIVYTYDTNGADDGIGETRLSRMTVTGDTASNEVVLFDEFPAADVLLHYGGAVEMGSDGKLYVTIGDHLIGANGQDRSNIKGTVIRLNPDGSIPTDNPFYNELTGNSRAIYAYGLRNPWQTAKHPTTGQIFISDVGASAYEELNVLEAGGNYGWFEAEGPKDPNDPTQASFIDPLWSFPHFGIEQGAPFEGCAIIGGSFYETPNPTFPAQYRGQFFTGDYCTGRIVTVDPVTGQASVFMDGFVEMVDMAVSPVNGDLYYIDRSFNGDNAFPKGGVGKVTFIGANADITITTPPSDVSIAVGGDASFFVGASAPGNVTYQWFRDGSPIAGETAPRLTLVGVTAADDLAEFVVTISNGQDSIQSDPAVLRITNNTVPVPTIDLITGADDGYRAGTPIGFSGSAVDAEDGAIPAADLSWEIRLNHDDHDHALANGVIGADGSFTVPPAIETSTNVWVTLYLTATDSDGTSTTVTARVDPKIVSITLDTDPAGLEVSLEAVAQVAPFTFDSVSGVDREIGAAIQQTQAGTTYDFASWSDGLGRNEIRTTPDVDTTWTATYTAVDPGVVCQVVANAGGGVTVSWQNKPGTEVVRNDGGWVATPQAGVLSYVDAAGTLGDGWLIRRAGVDEVCEGGEDPPPPVVCQVVANAGGGVTVSWQNKPGTEVVRNDGGWVATPQAGVLSYVDAAGTLGDGWLIRRAGVDEVCEGGEDPPPPVVCQVVANAGGGVTVSWQNKPGNEVVRNDGGWVATPQAGVLSYVDAAGTLGDGWLIRRAGVDEVCEGGEDPPPVDGCQVLANGGGVTITWENLAGTEIIRNDDGWVATPPDGTLSYSVPNASVDEGWFIRRTQGGGDEVCAIG